MGTKRERAVSDIEYLITAVDRCEAQLHEARRAYCSTVAQLGAGETVRTALAEVGAPELRLAITAAMADLETARKRSRISLMVLDIDEGSPVTAVARTWGVSHQLVSRYVQGDDGR